MDNEIEHSGASPIFKPGTGRALAYGWNAMKGNFLVFLLVEIICILICVPTGFGESADSAPFFNLLMLAYWFLLIPVIDYGASLIYLQGTRGDKVEINDLLKGFKNYLNVVLASLLVFGLIGIGLIIFIIPGVYVACRLAFVSYLVMDEDMDPVAAVEGSWRITRGHAWKIFCLAVISILLFFVGLLLMVIGSIPAVMWAKASFAALYLSITEQGPKAIAGTDLNEGGPNKALMIGAVCLVLLVAFSIFWSIQANVINEVVGDAETRALALEAADLNRLDIEANAGSIVLTGNDDITEIQVSADISEYVGELEYRLESNGSTATLIAKIHQAGPINWRDMGRIDLTVIVPTKMDINVDTGFSPVTVSDIIGNVNLDSGSGRIEVDDIDGSLVIDTGSGSVEVSNVSQSLHVDTGSGRVSATNIGTDVGIDTGSGRVDIQNVGGDVLADTGSGGMSIVSVVGDVTIDTGSGSITVDQIQGSLRVDQGSGSLSISNVDGELVIE